MYIIIRKYLEELLKLSDKGYPNQSVIKMYMNEERKAQKNTVRALAAILKEDNWEELVN